MWVVVGGVVAAGACGDPTTESRASEALGVVSESVAVGSELVLEVRAEDAGLYAGGAGCLVDLQNAVELVHVDGHDTVCLGGSHAPYNR